MLYVCIYIGDSFAWPRSSLGCRGEDGESHPEGHLCEIHIARNPVLQKEALLIDGIATRLFITF